MNFDTTLSLEHCAGIVLGAGLSRRFGDEDKLTAHIAGVPMLQHTINTVAALPLGQIILVSADAGRQKHLKVPPHIEVINNPDYLSGMGSSIAAGVAQIDHDIRAAFIVLGDMPFVPAEIYARLAAALGGDISAARPMTPHGAGHPVLFDGRHFNALGMLSGDKGAGSILTAAGSGVAMVETNDVGCFFDVDTPHALAAAETGRWKQT